MNSILYKREYTRCNKPGCRKCPHGPYWYAYWTDRTGKTCKKYVGKQLPVDLAEQLRGVWFNPRIKLHQEYQRQLQAEGKERVDGRGWLY